MISSYWTKDILLWERGSIFVVKGKEKRLWMPFRVIWIKYDLGRPPDDVKKFWKIKQDK